MRIVLSLAGLGFFVCFVSSRCAAAAGSLAEEFPAEGSVWQIAAADIAGDGKHALVYACYDGKVVCQDEPGGNVLWTYETGAFPYDLVTRDLDADGRAETLLALADGRLVVLTSAGKLAWQHKAPSPLFQAAAARTKEGMRVFAGGTDATVYVFDVRGRKLAAVPYQGRGLIRLLRGADVDGDGFEELILADNTGPLVAMKGQKVAEALARPQQSLWQVNLRTMIAAKPGDLQPNRSPTNFRPYSLAVADLDGDKKADLVFGSSYFSSNAVRAMSSQGTLLWEQSGIPRSRLGISQSMPVVCDAHPNPAEEVVVLDTNRLFVLDRKSGRILTQAENSNLAFTGLCVAVSRKGGSEIWLGSMPGGDERIYRVRFRPGWEEQFARLRRGGKIERIDKTLATISRQVERYPARRGGNKTAGKKTFHVVSSGIVDRPKSVRDKMAVVDFYRREFPYENCEFVTLARMQSREGVPGYVGGPGRQLVSPNRRVPERDIPKLLRMLEEGKYPFVVDVSHSSVPTMSLESVKEIVAQCPKYLRGFMISEDADQDPQRFEKFWNEYWRPVLDLCKAHGKKALMVEKGSFWLVIPAQKKFRALADGTYADVVVPSVEDSNSRCPELNLLARVGLFMCGGVNTFSGRTLSDEFSWHRSFEWEYPRSGHPHLRRLVSQAVLGATWFEYQFPTISGRQFTRAAVQSQVPFLHMLGKGIVVPPTREEMLALSPVAIRLREPHPDFVREAADYSPYSSYVENSAVRNSPFEGLAALWVMAPIQEHYLGRYLLMQDRHFGHFLPATPFGLPAIVPATASFHAQRQWQTDDIGFFVAGKRLSGKEAWKRVLADFSSAAEGLPVRVEGKVFAQVQKHGGGLRVVLIDSGWLDPDDRAVVLRFASRPPRRSVVDILSGERLKLADGTVSLTVPAGALRILDLEWNSNDSK